MQIDAPTEGAVTGGNLIFFQEEHDEERGQRMSLAWYSVTSTDPPNVGRRVMIDKLPGHILLEVFNFFVNEANQIEGWHTLAHVCQTWRNIVFDSPRRLNLRLLCTARRRVRELLYIWPALPIILRDRDGPTSLVEGVDNIIAALEQNDRVCEIVLGGIPDSLLERLAGVMQKPFPALIDLELRQNDESDATVVPPDPFLGGSTPNLRTLDLYGIGIPFPQVLKLLGSSNHLVEIHLHDIPHFGYIPPNAMATGLSVQPFLETLSLEFRSPLSRPDLESRHPPPLTRVVLPFLTSLLFTGVSEYLEDLVSQIDAPVLDNVTITFYNQLIFDTPLLHHFIRRTEKLMEHKYARVVFNRHSVEIRLSPEMGTGLSQGLRLEILCTEPDWQVVSMAQVCCSLSATLQTMERLDIVSEYSPWQNDAENGQWPEFLRSFASVKDLYLSEEVALRVAPALKEFPDGILLLPMLQNLFVEGPQPPTPVQESIVYFVAKRLRLGHLLTVNLWERE